MNDSQPVRTIQHHHLEQIRGPSPGRAPHSAAPYALVHTIVERGIGCGVGEADGSNRVAFYREVNDPQAYLDRTKRAGDSTMMPVILVPDTVGFAHLADPEGNVVWSVEGRRP